MTCRHSKTESIKASKDVVGLIFNYETKRCTDCGSVLWSEEIETKFQSWLGGKRKSNPEKFVIQKVALPKYLVDFASDLSRKNHTTESAVYQACLSVYFILGASRTSLVERIDEIKHSFDGPRVQKKFRVSPKLFLKISSNARLFELDMNEVTSWVIERVLLAVKEDIAQTRAEIECVLAA